MPVIWYGFGVIHWTQAELREIDINTQKVLEKEKFHHKCSDVCKLYLYWRYGGGIIGGVVDNLKQECTKMAYYVEWNEDPLVKIVNTDAGRQVHGLMWWDQIVNKFGTTDDINEKHKRLLDNMKMHGQLFRQHDNLELIDIERGHKWLHSSHLWFEMESLICAAQEYAPDNNVMKYKNWNQGCSNICRLIQGSDETIMYIVTGCEMLC